ncbi:hypothetical protein GQ457_03G028910 [Hibiscus cannabinus]
MGILSAWPETLSSHEKRVVEELVNAQELVHKILTSFDHSISLLTRAESVEVSQNQAASDYDSPCCKKRPVTKEKRGCYKRRKAEQTRTVASATVEDGHAWRKYGQKQILNSEHPRGYFRCTRKYDQGCKATKQVQRMDDGSQMYQITYIGTHTCRPDSFKAPQIIKDSESWRSYKMLTFGDSNIPSNTTSVKQEANEETTETTTTTTSGLTDMDSVIMWKDILGADYGDVVSNVYSGTEITSQSLELDLVTKPVEFEVDFEFDESEFV